MRSFSQSAFSLVELLVVIVVVSSMATLTIPAVSSVLGGRGIVKAMHSVGGAIEHAQALSRSGDTYVWMAIQNSTDAMGNPEIVVGLVKSVDGSASYDPANLMAMTNLIRIPGAELTERALIGSPELRELLGREVDVIEATSIQSPVSFSIGGVDFTDSVLSSFPAGYVSSRAAQN